MDQDLWGSGGNTGGSRKLGLYGGVYGYTDW